MWESAKFFHSNTEYEEKQGQSLGQKVVEDDDDDDDDDDDSNKEQV